MKTKIIAFFCIAGLIQFQSCSPAEGNYTGNEYMPDMAHSVAVEANVDNYYFYHTWGSKQEYRNYAKPLLPVKNTIARGSAGMTYGSNSKMNSDDHSNAGISTTNNGTVPYYYNNTEEERSRAMQEIRSNPLPITKDGLAQGKELYNIYCGICHGAAGDGAGYLVRDDGGVYPAQPANFLKDEFISATEGRYYHSIMHGKNVMMSYADKLSYTERWNVIHYIRSLQAASKNLKYSETENTFSGSSQISKPASLSIGNTTTNPIEKTVVKKATGATKANHK